MRANRQRVMHCPCGNAKVLALGLCATCYTLKRQDEEYFGGLREAVLERDGYRCRVCDASGRDKRSIIVHHRRPGKSVLNLMLSLVPGLPCQGSSNQGGPFRHAAASPGAVARAASEGSRTGAARLRLEEARSQARSSVRRRKGMTRSAAECYGRK